MSDLEEVSTLVDVLERRGRAIERGTVFHFLPEGAKESMAGDAHWVQREARIVARRLRNVAEPLDRALLLFPPGLDFIPAFFGCLYAGAIAVPCYPPKRNRPDLRLRGIVEDCQPSVLLGPQKVLDEIRERRLPSLESGRMRSLAVDLSAPTTGGEVDNGEDLACDGIKSDRVAFLQYTSGSTSAPKGVMVSHANLLANLYDLDAGWRHDESSVLVTWLPVFHDLGLIYGMLMPVYRGFHCYMIPPAAFLQRPLVWLDAISRYRGTHSAAPNFAYELCVKTIPHEKRATLDLRSWVVSCNGAEPVREETCRRFAEAFRAAGFDERALLPGYGLAECTLKVASRRRGSGRRIFRANAEAISRNLIAPAAAASASATLLVSNGWTESGTKIAIVDPETGRRTPPEKIGEIWVSGNSQALGYWNRPEATLETFCAYTEGDGPYLRTGDLGFIWEGELYVTGRLKDAIIIRGLNFYPEDIELTVEHCHPALRCTCSAAFSISSHEEQSVVVVCEVERTAIANLDVEKIAGAIRRAVAEEHELDLYSVTLLRPGSILKTSSGKIQRAACRAAFLSGELKCLGESRRGSPRNDGIPSEGAGPQSRRHSVIREWIIGHLAASVGKAPADIDPQRPFSELGLDSLASAQLSAALAAWIGRPLDPMLVYDFPNIEVMAQHLCGGSVVAEVRNESRVAEPIAIIGMACRFPGGESLDAFWRLLAKGEDAVCRGLPRRWRDLGGAEPVSKRKGSEWAALLERTDLFDAAFFGISPREAESMDPQQRLLLEVSWEALENAGLAPESLDGSRAGVFLGMSNSDYGRLQRCVDAYTGSGMALSIGANRLSYFYNFRGPSWVTDTACSSSLAAVHQACRSLHSDECDLALAGGVNLLFAPELSASFADAGMLAKDGRCKAFDSRADGYVRGEGCGIVILKPLSAAKRDGDSIAAIIRGSAVNQDGRSHGLTAPNGPSQEAVVREALRNAGVRPEQIQYVEAHGTGTALGDPIEFNALVNVLSADRSSEQLCWIGSVKTNIGHLEAAAGIAGLIKVALALENRRIPKNLHFSEPGPYLRLDGSVFRIPTVEVDWQPAGGPRLAGVSSFGFGGTNAHVVIGEAEVVSDASVIEPVVDPLLITISGRSTEALRELAGRYRDFLHDGLSLADVAFSANLGRSDFKHRVGCVASDVREFRAQLDGFLAGQTCPGLFVSGRSEYRGGEPGELALRYVRGEDVDFKAYHRIHPGRKIRLPNYPFQRERFWVGSLPGSQPIHPLIEAISKGEVSRIEQILEERLSPEDIPALGRVVRALTGELAGDPLGQPTGGRQLLGTFMEAKSPGDREAHLTEVLQEEIAALLRMVEPPDPDAGFFDLGMDSITALELREQLEVRLGTALPASLAFDCPNIRALSRYLMGINSPTKKETAMACASTDSEAVPATPQSRDGIATRLARFERLTQTQTPVD